MAKIASGSEKQPIIEADENDRVKGRLRRSVSDTHSEGYLLRNLLAGLELSRHLLAISDLKRDEEFGRGGAAHRVADLEIIHDLIAEIVPPVVAAIFRLMWCAALRRRNRYDDGNSHVSGIERNLLHTQPVDLGGDVLLDYLLEPDSRKLRWVDAGIEPGWKIFCSVIP